MIHIQLSKKTPPKSWFDKSNTHAKKITSLATLKLKKEYIDKTGNIWVDLRSFFEKYSNAKCWITEASECVSLYDVDHFRPKKEVRKIDTKLGYAELARADWKLGYWWLTYDWKNYRLIGQIPNRCFKGNYFPLESTSQVALRPRDKLSVENNLLLDPTRKLDISLITFDVNGKVIPVFTKAQNSWKNIRAVISIALYGLNEDKLVNARKKAIARCATIVSRANSKFLIMQKTANKKSLVYQEYQNTFADYCSDLAELINSNSEFSATARAYLRSFNYKWIDKFVFK